MRLKIIAAAAMLLFAAAAAFAFSAAVPEKKPFTTQKSPLHRKITKAPVYLAIPKGLNLTATPDGVVDKRARISIGVSEISAPYEKLAEEFCEKGLATREMCLKSRSDFLWNGSPAALFKVFNDKNKQSTTGQWVLLIQKSPDACYMIIGSYEAKDQKNAAKVLDIIKSAWVEPAEEQLAPEEAKSTGAVRTEGTPFHFAGVSQGATVYSKDGNLPTAAPDGAIFVISKIERAYIAPNGRLDFARDKIKVPAAGAQIEIASENEITVNGLPGVEIVAYAKDKDSTLIYQTVLFSGIECHVLVGMAKGAKHDNLEAFNRMAATYGRNDLLTSAGEAYKKSVEEKRSKEQEDRERRK